MLLFVLACADPLVSPNPGVPSPTPGEPPPSGTVVIEQLHLSRAGLGEATLVVTADAAVLIDVGNDNHASEVREALDRHGVTHLDAVVLTHAHADHIGGMDSVFADGSYTIGEVIWRGPVHLEDANQSELDEAEPWLSGATALCGDTGCALPHVMDVGPASLSIFLADARVATDAGVVDLVFDAEAEENARSLGGVLTFGQFDWLFAGDLTGGGKGTPDIESQVVAALPDLPPIDVMQINHHGISSSTSSAWVSLLADGPTHAVVGANRTYLDAPSEECLEALSPALQGGHVWVTERGLLGNRDDDTVVANGPVTITVVDGVSYTVSGGETTGRWDAL